MTKLVKILVLNFIRGDSDPIYMRWQSNHAALHFLLFIHFLNLFLCLIKVFLNVLFSLWKTCY